MKMGTRPERRTKRRQWLLFLFLMILLASYIVVVTESNIGPAILNIARLRVTQDATMVIGQAIVSSVGTGVRYEDLVHVKFDNNGKVSMLQANTVLVNKVSGSVLLAVEQSLEKMKEEHITIPLGQAVGSTLFSGLGPRVGVSVFPIGYAKVEIKDRFESSGINMTHHTVELLVSAKIRFVVPLRSGDIEVKNQMVLADGIIAGEVPDYVLPQTGIIKSETKSKD